MSPFKPTITVSQIETLLRCGKEFELRFLRGIDPVTNRGEGNEKIAGFELVAEKNEAPLRGVEWGILVHEILQFADCESLSNLETVVEQALINRRISPSTDLLASITEKMKNLLGNDTVRNHLVGDNGVLTEIPFLLDLGPFYLKGKIDRLFRKEGIWTAVDYKTDRIANREELASRAAAYEAQVACYALAVSEIMGEEIARTSLIFASLPAVETRVWTRKDLEMAKLRVVSLQNLLAPAGPPEKPFRHTDRREFCLHCPYYPLDYCGVKKL